MGPPSKVRLLGVGGSLKNGCQQRDIALLSTRGRICSLISKRDWEKNVERSEKKRAHTIGQSWDWMGVTRSGQGQLKVVCINAKLGSPHLSFAPFL